MNDLNNEVRHEQLCSNKGTKKYEKDVRKAREKLYYSSTKAGLESVHLHTNLYAMQVADRIKKNWLDGSIGTTRVAARRLKSITEECGGLEPKLDDGGKPVAPVGDGVYRVSMMALKCIVDRFCRSDNGKVPIVQIADGIGSWIEDEWRLVQEFEKQPEEVARYGRKIAARKGSTPSRRRKDARLAMHSKARRCGHPEIATSKLGKEDRIKVGLFLLEVAADIGILDIESTYEGKKQKKLLTFNASYAEALTEREDLYGRIAYLHEPMVEQPMDWEVSDTPSSQNISGGYHWEHAKNKRTMCRHYFSESNFQQEAVDTINNMQKVGYKVYPQTLKVANELMHQVGHFQPMPKEVEPLIAPPNATDDELWKLKREKEREHEEHRNKVKKFMRTRTVLNVANDFNDGREFYYGWSFDYRGRMYPLNSFLQIQGTDFDKSLICFSEGCELTKSGRKWAARALASAYIGTGDSYKTRERWTEDNQALIKRVANDPHGYRCDWEVAKEPWVFLQLCFEWNAVVIAGTKELWQVPVPIDSTASGLQLLSAMRLDKQGMTFANLLPPNKDDGPLDAYQAVLALARGMAAQHPETAELTVYLQDRKVGKPALMLSVYGGSQLTIRDKIKEHFKDKEIAISKENLSAITSLVIKASKQLFPAAYEALAWLKKLGKIVAERDGRVQWHTPTGNLIDLTENEQNIIQVRTETMGKINVSLGETQTPDTKSMVNAFAPGFVHSWDASLCQAAFHNWTKPLALVHDSVSVLPSDMNAAVAKIKGSFRRICAGDVLANLAEDMGVSEDQLPRLEWQQNNLLDEVESSEYFFN